MVDGYRVTRLLPLEVGLVPGSQFSRQGAENFVVPSVPWHIYGKNPNSNEATCGSTGAAPTARPSAPTEFRRVRPDRGELPACQDVAPLPIQ